MKIIIFALFFYFLILFQTSFLVHFDIAGAVPNFILISVILYNFFEKSQKNTGFLIAAIGGFYLDLFSGFQIGVSIFALILLAFLIKKVLKFIGEENIIYFIFLLVGGLIFYDLFLIIFNSVLGQSFSFSFIFNRLRIVEIGYNLIIGILFFCFIRLCFSRK